MLPISVHHDTGNERRVCRFTDQVAYKVIRERLSVPERKETILDGR